MDEVHCYECHKLFTAKRCDALTCGPTCRQRAHRKAIKERKLMEKRRDEWTKAEKQFVIDGVLDVAAAVERFRHS